RYRGEAKSIVQTVTVRSWSGKNPVTGAAMPDEIRSVGPQRVVNVNVAKGELSCAGWQDAWSKGDKKWSLDDCLSDNSVSEFTCSPAPIASFDGHKGLSSATVFRDGKSRKITWASASKPEGKG